MLAELGAQIVKTYYCEDFEKVTSGCPVPIVVAGGKQLPPKEALTLAYRAISEGARGVDMEEIFSRQKIRRLWQRLLLKLFMKIIRIMKPTNFIWIRR
ncbi:MAG: hypothetical protein ACLSFZ_07410 [Frisingicoccus sp.]